MPRRFKRGILLGSLVVGLALTLLHDAGVIQGAELAQNEPTADTIAAFAKGGCAGCHTIPGIPSAVGSVGPDLSAIGADASGRKSDAGARAYLLESLLTPAAFIAPVCPNGPCPENVMPPNLGERLTSGEIDLIVDYLLSLEGEGAVIAEAYELLPIPIVRPLEAASSPFAQPERTFSDAQVLLGKYLFFDARLSGDASISCASCHLPQQAWSDGLPLSAGYPSTLYFRNTPTILNTAFLKRLYWDGRMDGEDMPTLVRDHLTEAHFMNTDGRLMVERLKQVPEYVQLFEDAFGVGPGFGRTLNAITAYVQSINSQPAPYDLFLEGDITALSNEAQAGKVLFEGEAGCSACHVGPVFSDEDFYALGVPDNPAIWSDPLRHITLRRFFRLFGTQNYRQLSSDPGLFALTQNMDDWGAFRTAPLREVAATGPYMHSGVFATLEEVVRFYDRGGGPGNAILQALDLTDEEISQLVSFLESLSSDLPLVETPALPDYQLRILGENQ